MIGDVAKAAAQLRDPRFLKVLLTGVAVSFALLLGFSIALVVGLRSLIDPALISNWPFLNWLTLLSGVPAFLLMSMFMMVPVASAITGLFLDTVAQAVEEKHYPHNKGTRKQSFAENLKETCRFLCILIAANLCALVLYILLIPLAPIIFITLNGFLLGREYAQMVASRHLTRGFARQFRRKHRFAIWGLGILIALTLTIPIFNLLAPVVAMASFTHLFHRKHSF